MSSAVGHHDEDGKGSSMQVHFDAFGDPAGQLAVLTGIIQGPDEQIWFAATGSDRVGRIDPGTGQLQVFADPAGLMRGPANLFPGADGRMWFTCPGIDAIGRIDPFAADPATSIRLIRAPGLINPVAIKSAPDGRIWCSLRAANALASLDPRSSDPASTVRIVSHPDIELPAAIFAHPDGRLWFTTTGRPGIGSVDMTAADPAGTVALFRPDGIGALRAWAMDSAGRLWVSMRNPGGIARFDPADLPGSWSPVIGPSFVAPDGATAGPDDRIWVVDSGRQALLRVDPDSGTVDEWTGDPALNEPFDLKPGPGRTLWCTNRGAPIITRVGFGTEPG